MVEENIIPAPIIGIDTKKERGVFNLDEYGFFHQTGVDAITDRAAYLIGFRLVDRGKPDHDGVALVALELGVTPETLSDPHTVEFLQQIMIAACRREAY